MKKVDISVSYFSLLIKVHMKEKSLISNQIAWKISIFNIYFELYGPHENTKRKLK